MSSSAICTLSLHDAPPISALGAVLGLVVGASVNNGHLIPIDPSIYFIDHLPVLNNPLDALAVKGIVEHRSEEHTSELQSRPHLVCRLLLEKKKPLMRRTDA